MRLFDFRFWATLALVSAIFCLQAVGVSDVMNDTKTELYDYLVKLRRNTVGGAAPPVVNLAFDRASRKSWWEGRIGRDFSHWPTITPLGVVGGVLNVVKAGCERHGGERTCPRLVVVDIDVLPVGAQRSAREIADFTATLEAWAADPNLPLIAFVRAPEWKFPGGEEEGARREFVLAAALRWDEIIARAPNMTWAAGEALTGEDGIVRQVPLYTCVLSQGLQRTEALPHVALFALAAWHGNAAAAKAGVLRGVAGLCGGAQADASPFAITVGRGKTLRFRRRETLIGYHLADPAKFGAAPVLRSASGAPGTPAVQVIPAHVVLQPGARADFADHAIVVLSSMQPTYEDIHWTPYGPMAGGLILANTARSLILDGPIQGISGWTRCSLLLLTCIGMHIYTLLMARWHRGLRRSLRPWMQAFRIISSPQGAKFAAFFIVYAAGRFCGIWLTPSTMWEVIAITGFVVVLYSLFNELHEAWRAR